MKSRNIEPIVSGAILAVLAASPFAFGSVHPWSYGIESSAIFVLFATLLRNAWRKGRLKITSTLSNYLLPLALFFFVVQAVPLPSSIVYALSPGRAAIDAASGGNPGYESLALYPWAVKQQAFILTAALLIFLLTINLVREKEKVEKFQAALYIVGLILAALALIQRISAGEPSFLPFINRNHFAGYMELLVPMTVSALVYNLGRLKKQESARETLLQAVSSSTGSKIIFLLFLAVIFSACIVLTYSRGGMAGMIFSLVVLAALTGRNRKIALASAVCGAAIVFFIFHTDGGRIAGRVERLVNGTAGSALLREEIWNDTASMIKVFPATGVGLGGFETAFPYFKTNSIQMNFFQPESDYLYVLAEGGIIGLSLAAAFVFIFIYETWGRFRRRKDPFAKSVYAGAVAGLSALLVHGLVDTSLHMPSILFTCSALLGLAYVSVSVRFRYPTDGERDKYLREKSLSLAGFPAKAAVAACIVMALTTSAASLSSAGADLAYRFGLNLKSRLALSGTASRKDYEELRGEFNAACALDPLCAQYEFERGRAEEWLADYYSSKEYLERGSNGRSRKYYSAALESFDESLDSNPYSSFGHLLKGRLLARGFGGKGGQERQYEAALKLNPTSGIIRAQVRLLKERLAYSPGAMQ